MSHSTANWRQVNILLKSTVSRSVLLARQSPVYLGRPEDLACMRPLASILPIILAAGDSTRMGYPKALLPLGEELFITRILRVLRNAGLPRPVIILGRAAPVIQPRIQDWPADIRINSDPDRGQLSSIQLALANIGPEYAAGMIWPVDQPAVSEDLVRRLAELFLSSESRIVFPKCGGKRGHPAIFHRDLFQEFMDAPLEEGPKKHFAAPSAGNNGIAHRRIRRSPGHRHPIRLPGANRQKP